MNKINCFQFRMTSLQAEIRTRVPHMMGRKQLACGLFWMSVQSPSPVMCEACLAWFNCYSVLTYYGKWALKIHQFVCVCVCLSVSLHTHMHTRTHAHARARTHVHEGCKSRTLKILGVWRVIWNPARSQTFNAKCNGFHSRCIYIRI